MSQNKARRTDQKAFLPLPPSQGTSNSPAGERHSFVSSSSPERTELREFTSNWCSLGSEEQAFENGTQSQGREVAKSHHRYQAGREQDPKQKGMGRKSSGR